VTKLEEEQREVKKQEGQAQTSIFERVNHCLIDVAFVTS